MNDTEFETADDLPEESDLPQTIPLDPGKLIDQLMRRYGAQNQQQVWENAQLATENDALKTLLAEAQNERAQDAEMVSALAIENDRLSKRVAELVDWTEGAKLRQGQGRNATMTEQLSSADDPQEVDAFRAMATGQPGLAYAPAPAESSATTPQP